MIELNRQLEKLESDIKQSVMDSDEFLFAKLNRLKSELQQKIFFAESRNLKSEIETLTGERQTAIEVRQDLTAELKQAADETFRARSIAFDCQEKHSKIQTQLYFLDEKIRSDGDNIKTLSKRLQTHIDGKLNTESGDKTNA